MRRMALAMAIAGILAGCNGPELETRTFGLRYLQTYEAEALITPYVFTDREGANGAMKAGASAITVRETPDNLARIERMLGEFDVPRPLIMLHFQVIRAGGATTSSPAIADVERELRRLFRFEGYELLAETRVGVMGGASFRQVARGGDQTFHIQGGVREVRGSGTSPTLSIDVQLWAGASNRVLETSVTIPVGHAVVMGTADTEEGDALILVVRAEIAGGDAAPPGAADTAATPG